MYFNFFFNLGRAILINLYMNTTEYKEVFKDTNTVRIGIDDNLKIMFLKMYFIQLKIYEMSIL